MKLPAFSLLLLFFLVGCGNDAPRREVTADDNRQALTILTWRYLPQDRTLWSQFGRDYNARIDVTVMTTREMMRAASQQGLPAADIILVPTLEDAVRLREFGTLQPFFVNSFTTGDVDDKFIDNEGYYAGLTRWTMATVYNPNAVTAEEASTYGNLAKAPLRGLRLGLAHPDSSGMAGVVSGLISTVSPEAADVWARVMYQRATGGPSGSDHDQLDRMLAGELDLAFVSVGNAVRWFLNGDPQHYKAAEVWRVRFPKTDNGGINFPNMTCLTVGNNAPNRALAMLFVDFMFSKPTQEQLTSDWFEYPSQTFTTANEYLLGFPDRVGRQLPAEQLDQNIPAAWGLINRIAAETAEAAQ